MNAYKNGNLLKFSQQSIEDPAITPKNSIIGMQEEIDLPQGSRRINRSCVRVLDAPSLQDDFYLNLLDWSEHNVVAVGLQSSVYLWNALSSRVTKLCDLGLSQEMVTAINWAPRSHILAVSNSAGEIQIWDAVRGACISSIQAHSSRIGCLAWNSTNFLSSGSRDKTIKNWDLRSGQRNISKYDAHKQEVCGLKWSYDHRQLASGGNDNKLCLWNCYSNQPVYTMNQHNAAVKALAWSPHQHSLLVSGGGTADQTMKFWNTLSGELQNSVAAGSQVCSLMFSKTVNELVSTHGYSLHEINVWSYPKMNKLVSLTGHSCRVLYLGMSPDGSTIVTGAGDETLRFWNLFPGKQKISK